MYSNSRNSKLRGAVGETAFIDVIFEVIRMFVEETQKNDDDNYVDNNDDDNDTGNAQLAMLTIVQMPNG